LTVILIFCWKADVEIGINSPPLSGGTALHDGSMPVVIQVGHNALLHRWALGYWSMSMDRSLYGGSPTGSGMSPGQTLLSGTAHHTLTYIVTVQ